MNSELPIDRNLLTAPLDPEIEQRTDRLRMLDLGDRPVPEFDSVAARLAEMADAPYAMVNFISEKQQYFAGLYTPDTSNAGALDAAQTAAQASPGRVMARDHGYCPHVVVRRKALILGDVCDYPRFAGNPVVDEIGIRAYMGVPLIEEETGSALGTICAVASEPRPWGRPELDALKSMATEVMRLIQRRG
ncbi:GAF domain-containing protein [Saccharomonospora saliphila]|uniref:GAF domain-containing protein n=1 Tax=Saccharomonospora saliphila TaxID=369829 RepID=UPI000366C5E5|nr:GAF domain-containing protein [Saccharomonospora saliphila]